MRIDTLALQMRPRAPHEAADLGVRLCQKHAREVYRCYLVLAIPMALLAMALFEVRPWLPILVMWLAKPWLNRAVLFVLARAAFGQESRVADLWREQRTALWSRLILTWTWLRLSPWRSFTLPVYQLEGHSLFQIRRRVRQLRRRYSGAALMVTLSFWLAQIGFASALLSLAFWFSPQGQGFDIGNVMEGQGSMPAQWMTSLAYVVAVLILEPFYVAAGFGMYLNRRAELEAWDIEQEFRRAFAS